MAKKKVRQRCYATIEDLYAAYNLRTKFRLGPESGIESVWDGKGVFEIHAPNTGWARKAMVAHEIAHYLVAARERRTMRNFDLDPGSRQLSPVQQSEEEYLASLLGIFLVREFWGRKMARTNYEDHNWAGFEPPFNTVRDLLDAGHLTWQNHRLMPTCLVQPPAPEDTWKDNV